MSLSAQTVQESHVTLQEDITTIAVMEPPSSAMTTLHCPHCDYSSSNKHYLRQHIDLVHTTERPFKCPFCDYAGKRSHSLKEHLIVHSDERPYQCTQCNAKFRKKGHLTNHYRMHSEAQSMVICTICSSSEFSCRDDLYTHLRTVHADKTDTEVFCCNRCSYATTVKGNLHVHEMAHPDYRNIVQMKPKLPPSANIILKCSECGFETNQRKVLEQHVVDKHLKGVVMKLDPTTGKTDTASKTVQNACPRPSSLPQSVQHTIAVMSPQSSPSSPHQTPSTKSRASPAPSPLHHVPIVNLKQAPTTKQYKCTECGLIDTDQQRLAEHMLLHMDKFKHTVVKNQGIVGQYKCSLCEYYTDTQRTLKAHMWKHSGHQGLQYPTFQNGPLSIYDGTPLAAKNFVNVIQPPTGSSTKVLDSDAGKILHENNSKKSGSKMLDSHNNNGNNMPVSQTAASRQSPLCPPRVIVQTIAQADNIGSAIYQRTMSSQEHNSSVSDEETTTAHEPAATTASANDPLQVMTAVCETVERQPTTMEQEGNDGYSATEKTAATLLSLLRQGPNINPACAVVYETVGEDGAPVSKRAAVELEVAGEEVIINDGQESSDSGQASDDPTAADNSSVTETTSSLTGTGSVSDKPKQGICSSLLAVIEQLRERQAEDGKILFPKGKRRKRKRNAKDDFEVTMSEFKDVEGAISNIGIAYRCKPCQFDTESATEITEHIQQHRDMGKVVDESYGGIASMVRVTFNCKACSFTTLSSKDMRKHLLTHQSVEDMDVSPDDFNLYTPDSLIPHYVSAGTIFRCRLCHYRSSANLMKQHMKMHKSKKPHECSLCDYVADGATALQDHMIQHCKLRQFQCKHCPAVFNYKSQLRAHTRIHEDGQAFYCEHCGYVTSYFDSFHEHLNTHSEVTSSFTCIACRSSFTELISLQRHMKDECEEVKKLHGACNIIRRVPQSQISDQAIPSIVNNTSQRKTVPNSNTASCGESVDRTLKCDQCEFVALSVRSLKSHLKRHINDKRYIQQPLEQYKCNMCGYTCHHMPSLKSHMWRHANDSNFSYTFTNLLNEATTPVDSDGRPLITLRCCQCGFETLDKTELNNHMKSHWDIIKKTFDVGVQIKDV